MFGHKKNEVLKRATTQAKLENNVSEWSQSQKTIILYDSSYTEGSE